MFAVVTVEPFDGGLWKRVGRALRPPIPRAEQLRDEKLHYWLIHAPHGRKGVNWEAVAEVAGRQRGKLVIDRSVQLPPDAPVVRFEPTQFERQLVFNAARRVLDDSHVELWKRTVGVVDPQGCCQRQVMELLPHATCIKVCTDQPQRYEAFCRQMLELYGAPVLLCHSVESLQDCLLAVSVAPGSLQPERCPVLCAHPSKGATAVDGLACKEPKSLVGRLPVGVDVTYFLGAAYELGYQRQWGELCPDYCRIGGRVAPLEELTAMVTAQAPKITNWQGDVRG